MEKIMENSREWETETKCRYYLNGHYAKKSNAYFTTQKNDTASGNVWEFKGGYVVAKKSYNGALIEEITENY